MIKPHEAIEKKVTFIPHDGVNCDSVIIGGEKFNHVDILRLWKFLDAIIWGERVSRD